MVSFLSSVDIVGTVPKVSPELDNSSNSQMFEMCLISIYDCLILYMYVCMYTCKYVCMYLYIYILWIYVYLCYIHDCLILYMYVCKYVCMYVYIYIYIVRMRNDRLSASSRQPNGTPHLQMGVVGGRYRLWVRIGIIAIHIYIYIYYYECWQHIYIYI